MVCATVALAACAPEALGEVRDETPPGQPESAGILSSRELLLHIDLAQIVGQLCGRGAGAPALPKQCTCLRCTVTFSWRGSSNHGDPSGSAWPAHRHRFDRQPTAPQRADAPRGGPTGWISQPRQPTRRFSERCEWSSIRVTEQPANISDGSRAAVTLRLMVRPVCPQLQKCPVCPRGYAWCQQRIMRAPALNGCPKSFTSTRGTFF
jgi:hypothetical protein